MRPCSDASRARAASRRLKESSSFINVLRVKGSLASWGIHHGPLSFSKTRSGGGRTFPWPSTAAKKKSLFPQYRYPRAVLVALRLASGMFIAGEETPSAPFGITVAYG
jgi:hypothetical protein